MRNAIVNLMSAIQHARRKGPVASWTFLFLILTSIAGIAGCNRKSEELPRPDANPTPAGKNAGPQSQANDKWIEQLKSPNPAVRLEAVTELAKRGPQAANAIPALSAALKDPDPKVRAKAAHAFVMMGPAAKPAMPALVAALKDPDARQYAGTALNLIGPESLPELTRALSDPDPLLRRGAAFALQNRRPPPVQAIKSIESCLADVDQEVRLSSLGVLYGMGASAEPAVPKLILALRHKDAETQMLAAKTIGVIGPGAKAATNDLARMLEKPYAHRDIPYVALNALEKIGPGATEALPSIRMLLRVKNFDMQLAAASALKKISTDHEPGADAVLGVQNIAKTYKANLGKTVTWHAHVGADGFVYGESHEFQHFEISLTLRGGPKPKAGTTIVFSGTLSPNNVTHRASGTAKEPTVTIGLQVTDAVIHVVGE